MFVLSLILVLKQQFAEIPLSATPLNILIRNTKQINIKNRTYYFFNDMINIKDFDPNLIKIDKTLYKNIGIYHIGCIAVKRISGYENINSVYPLYLMIGEVDGYIECSSTEENNGNKYLTFASTDKSKKVLEKYIKLWDKIKYYIQTINSDKTSEYEKDYMRIKFNSHDDLPLNKIPKLYMLTIIVRSVFEKDGKYYPQVFLDECLYEV